MKDNNTKKTNGIKWHAIHADAVLEKLETSAEKGLTSEEVSTRLETYGPNELPKGKKQSALVRFMLQFHNVLIYVLLVAAVITALMDHWIDTWVILAVVVVNAIIGFVQEGKAEKALESIAKMMSLDAVVLRDGKKQTIPAIELVPGDLVHLKSGDKIPADLRLIKTRDFRVEESPLTGESTAVDKQTEPVDEKAIVGDRISMAFSGTVVTYGRAEGIVTETGLNTELGKIKQMLTDVKKITTPLLQQIEKFGKWLSVFILVIAACFFAFGYFLRDYTVPELFLAVIGLIVAAIPEGLPAILTITLAIGVQSMAARNAIIRKLPSVETLGAVNVICSDKTGTLTKNEMTAKTIVTADKIYEVEGSGYAPKGSIICNGEKINPEDESVLFSLLKAGKASNNADISEDENGQWILTGAPTEGAILTLAMKAGLSDYNPKRIDIVPFESDHKYMATLNDVNGKKVVYMTGAPERVLEMCNRQLHDGETRPVDNDYWEKQMEAAASKGQRLLGVAYSGYDSERTYLKKEELEKKKIFLGVVGILDPPRDEAITAIQDCKTAGVHVKMITGDHSVTARAIGKELGIGDGEKAITGAELEEMTDEQLREIVEEYDIFARTSPEHKLRLVDALQKNGKRCAMTGDGVNDAPALKKADIGIAMGIKGTEVTKDASEMVLADDNFATIVYAIEEGRTVYDNIRKALLFILPTNGAESLVLMAAILMGIVMPITPAQILWVNMVTAVTLALALAFEPKSEGIMKRPPRSPDEPILGYLFLWRITFVSFLIGGVTMAMFYYIKSVTGDYTIARTVAVNTLVAGQLFYLFNCKRIKESSIGKGFFNNKYMFIASGVLIVLQLLFVLTPFMNTFFETVPVSLNMWLYSLAAGITIFFIIELEKIIITKLNIWS